MILALVFICIAFAPKPSDSLPVGAWADTALGYDITTEFMDGYYGPWNLDYLRGNRLWGLPYSRGLLPSDRYALDVALDAYDPLALGPDFLRTPEYLYNGFSPKTVDVAKEKYVRDNGLTETEYGVRDSISVRPGLPRSSRYLSPYLASPYSRARMYDYDLLPYNRRAFAAGLGTPRPSSLRTGGDFLYLRR
ncbi:uncharacterized protein TNIN_404411 [Trichonephila inaurata madagascariensis]|uniref:Uncharacterized protein n=1 Tax=Trichonephila inaurata madagascariensis TaxID=2747483 RepID=A0A8X7CMZ7_9ARAC|nr:uncharacterized protein TNIN_404411 [Trichonephila inaurata madagascariensis]